MGGDITLILIMGVFLGVAPAIPYSILHKKTIVSSWLIFIGPAMVFSYLMNQPNTSHHQMEIAGTPILILIVAAVVSGIMQKRLAKPSMQTISVTIGIASAIAIGASFWGFSESKSLSGGDPASTVNPAISSTSVPPIVLRDKAFYSKGYQQKMTRQELIAEFGAPEIATDTMMGYKAIRPENNKEGMCFFRMERWASDPERVVSLTC
jgi:hypothetical protein